MQTQGSLQVAVTWLLPAVIVWLLQIGQDIVRRVSEHNRIIKYMYLFDYCHRVHTLQSDVKHMNVVGNILITFGKYYARGKQFGTQYSVRINTD